MKKQLLLITALIAVTCAWPGVEHVAGQETQADPVVQCAEGVRLFYEGESVEPLRLLEAGFSGREDANFENLDDLGLCALALGVLRRENGDGIGATEAFTFALQIFQETNNYNLEGTTLANMAALYQTQGNFEEAQKAYEQALRLARETRDLYGEGTVLHNIAQMLADQGRYTEALDHYRQALAIFREIDARYEVGDTLFSIGEIRRIQGWYREAQTAFQEALVIDRELRNRSNEAATLNNLGLVLAAQGHCPEALANYEQALLLARELGDRRGEGGILNNMGSAYEAQGRSGEALVAHQRALEIAVEVKDRTGASKILNNIGLAYLHVGRNKEAFEAFKQSLAIRRETGDRKGEATTLDNIGLLLSDLGSDEEALVAYQEALAIIQEEGSESDKASLLLDVGSTYHSLGRLDDALRVYQEALTTVQKTGDRVSESYLLANIGALYHRQGRYASAIEKFEQAVALAGELNTSVAQQRGLVGMGRAYEAQGQLNKALDAYQQALDILEQLRATAGNDRSRASFIAQYSYLYDDMVMLLHQMARDAEAFNIGERGRARAFLDSMATGYVELTDDASTNLLVRERDTYAAYVAVQDALAKAQVAQSVDSDLVAELKSQLETAKTEHDQALAAIAARNDQLRDLVPGRGAVLPLPEVQALLDEPTTLVEYYVLGDKGSLAFVITAASMQVVELPQATPDNLDAALTKWYTTTLNLDNAYPLPVRELYTELIAPISKHLQTTKVSIIPHRLLHYVPFAALTDGEHYFGEQFELSILPSASSLRFIQQNAAAPDGKEALVFGNPTSNVPDLKALVYAEQEARDTASLLRASAYLRKDATEARLRAGSTGAKVLHLSAHGGYNIANPLYSTIYLAPGDGQDGRLETYEVYSLDLRGNEVVVLSACETNVGELSAGDEVVGLTRAFFFAGAPTVISSLWTVDDAATGALMTSFYRHWLQDGMSKAGALQAAQSDMRKNPNWVSPFYWAGFVLNGDPGQRADKTAQPTTTPDQTPNKGLGGGPCGSVGLMAFAVIGLWFVKKRLSGL